MHHSGHLETANGFVPSTRINRKTFVIGLLVPPCTCYRQLTLQSLEEGPKSFEKVETDASGEVSSSEVQASRKLLQRVALSPRALESHSR